MKKQMFAGKKGHFTGGTVLISVLTAMVAYVIVEKFVRHSTVKHESKNPLRVRK